VKIQIPLWTIETAWISSRMKELSHSNSSMDDRNYWL